MSQLSDKAGTVNKSNECFPKHLRGKASPKPENIKSALTRLYPQVDEPSPELFKHFRGHYDKINSTQFHPNIPQVLTGGADGYVMLWTYNNDNARVWRFEGHSKAVNDVAFNRDGDLIVSGSDDATLRIWVPSYKGDTRVFRAHQSPIRSVACSPTSDHVASASDDKTVKLWSVGSCYSDPTKNHKIKVGSRSFISSYLFHKNWVRSVRFHREGNLLCTASDDGTICIIDTRSNTKSMEIKLDGDSPNYAEFIPTTGDYIGATTKNTFNIYDARNGRLVQLYKDIHVGSINKFCFHSSGNFAFTVSDDGRIKILDIVEGRPIFTLSGHMGGVSSVGCSNDGSLFATGGVDKQLLIWRPFLVQRDYEPEVNNENEAQEG